MNVFEAVKQSVTTRQAAEHYGIRIGRNGMACCPFHHDSPMGLPLAAIWLLGKVQSLKFAIQDWVYG